MHCANVSMHKYLYTTLSSCPGRADSPAGAVAEGTALPKAASRDGAAAEPLEVCGRGTADPAPWADKPPLAECSRAPAALLAGPGEGSLFAPTRASASACEDWEGEGAASEAWAAARDSSGEAPGSAAFWSERESAPLSAGAVPVQDMYHLSWTA
jgi:hypothetical protein